MPVLVRNADDPSREQLTKLPQRLPEFGACVWAEMQRRGIAPTPQAYAVWFAYRLRKDEGLSVRVDELLDQCVALTPALLQELHAEFMAGNQADNVFSVDNGIAEVGEIADTLTQQVAGGQVALAEYGAVLGHLQRQIGAEPTVEALVTAVTTLTAETARASERNRELEQKLAAASGRISQLRRSLNEIKQAATVDVLTGIANRRVFEARLRRVMTQARDEPSTVTSVLLLDVDHFKRFNDTYGHKTGDLVLRLVARLLSDSVKGRDLVARYGGEEFAIILAGADLAAAHSVGRQICEMLSAKRLILKGTQRVAGELTISVGAARIRADDTAATLVARADAALYVAKSRGRNRVCSDPDPVMPTAS